MNAAIEFHDSTLVAVERRDDTVVVRLNAYLHRSEGRPGYDAGTGWIQVVELTFAGGLVERSPAELPLELDDGELTSDFETQFLLALPAASIGDIRFTTCGLYGDELIVRGNGLVVKTLDEARYVEDFPGTNP